MRGSENVRVWRCIIIFIYFLIYASSGQALESSFVGDQYLIHYWTTKNGLPQNSVFSLLQDKTGYLWIGTQNGLARFDGVRFQIFNKHRVPALKDNFIRVLYQDKEGKLWIGTSDGGLVFYDGRRFQSLKETSFGKRIFTIIKDLKGKLWIGTDHGLAGWDGQRWLVMDETNGLPGHWIFTLWLDHAQRLWIGTENGIVFFDNGILTRPKGSSKIDKLRIYALLQDRRRMLWIGTNRGLYQWDGHQLLRPDQPEALSTTRVLSLLEDKESNLWIGTVQGLYRYDGHRYIHMTTTMGLSDDHILSLMEDREGNLWVGTSSGGLNRLSKPKVRILTQAHGLPSNHVRTVFEDRTHRIWIGTDKGLVHLEHGRIYFHGADEGLTYPQITSIFQDRSGHLWVGTFGGGVYVQKGDRFTSLSTQNGLSNNLITAITEDFRGQIWVGTGNGLNRITPRSITIFNTSHGLSHNMITFLHEDRHHRLWVGTYGGGLNIFEHGQWKTITREQGLPSNKIIAISEDDEGYFWLGTLGQGLIGYKPWTEFHVFQQKDGLPDDNILSILDDQRGHLWICTLRGIAKISKRSLKMKMNHSKRRLTIQWFAEGSGMKNAECTGGSQPAAWSTRDGWLLFSTVGGLAMVHPDQIPRNLKPPPVIIESIMADKVAYSPQNSLSLPAGTRALEIRFTALSFTSPRDVRFRYRLFNFDNEWTDVGNRRVAYYTHLPPGHYQFQVIAANNDGVWNRHGAILNFTIRAYFYQTVPFYITLALTILGILYGVYRVRVNHLKMKAAYLQELAEERRLVAERMEYLAHHDWLTKLPNRLAFYEFLQDHLESANERLPFCIFLINLDRFREINEALGHEIGDIVIKTIAQRLQTLTADRSYLAHMGIDEFAIFSMTSETHSSEAFAQNILEMIAQPIAVDDHELHVTASIGISRFPKDGLELSALMKCADIALLNAKNNGGNSFCFVNPELSTIVLERMHLRNQMYRALHNHEFILRFQPQIHTATGQIVGCEALIRWAHPLHGILFPIKFIELAEETNLIELLGVWVLRTACLHRVQWNEKFSNAISIAVNLSARQFLQQNIVQTIATILSETQMDPRLLVLEITESTAMRDLDKTVQIMNELTRLGVRIDLDDFGKGFSSLTYLKRFPIHALKIDISFIRDLTFNPADAAIVSSIITLARGLNLQVIAEGVETEEQLIQLKNLGCDIVQGFYTGPPMPAEDFINLVLTQKHG